MRFLLPGKIYYFLTLLFLSYLRVALGENGSVGVEQGQVENGVNQSLPSESSTKASSTISAAALGKSGSVSLEQGQVVNGVNRSVLCESSTKASSTISGADSSKTPQPVLVIQTPNAVKVMEGSTQRMECCIPQINSSVWYILWFKNGTESALTNSSRMSIITSEKERFSHLILSKTEIADSGIYRCILHDHRGCPFPSNGTQLTVDAFYPSRSKECCYSYKRGGPLPVPLIAKYYKTPSDCALDAVVFVMKSKKTVCANPRESWVRRTIAILQRNK